LHCRAYHLCIENKDKKVHRYVVRERKNLKLMNQVKCAIIPAYD
jgi:heat shock protein HspQ